MPSRSLRRRTALLGVAVLAATALSGTLPAQAEPTQAAVLGT